MDAARIAAFARGIGEIHPRHTDPSRSDFTAPPLVVATVVIPGTGLMLTEIDVGLDLMRIVHGGIELYFDAPVHLDDAIACTATFEGVEERSTGSVISFGFSVDNQDGRRVSSGVTRYFVRGKSKSGARSEEAERGEPALCVSETVPEGQSLLYAEGSGDVFPIHTSREVAQMVGLPDVILHGMCTLAFALRAVVGAALDGDATRVRSVSVRFARMVLHGDTLTTRVYADGDGAYAFATENQRGERVLVEGHVGAAAQEGS